MYVFTERKQNFALIEAQLSGLKKMVIIPKKLSNNDFKEFIANNPSIKLNLLKIMGTFLKLTEKINNESKTLDQNSQNSKEMMERNDFIQYIISEYKNSNLFQVLSNEIQGEETELDILVIVVQNYKYLCQIDIVIKDRYLSYEEDVLNILLL